ncbi:MAG TPA: DUF1926 domain-containing protein [Deltaproteobacteria bacterium]|nr:DUF1926 domain-containing protein [Deltaproteobacteria bacterium]
MTRFIFCIHIHQPVGNFPSVMEEAYEKSYRPFLEALSRRRRIRLSMHITGYLLDWLAANRPEYIALLRSMVEDGRVEMLGGGYYEPVLAVIPGRDRLGQIAMLSRRIEELFGRRPRGMWLAERVWDPALPGCIRGAGLEYVVVDDYHFRKSGLRGEELGGCYITEDVGEAVKVFPGNERLRYLIPFEPAGRFEEYVRGLEEGSGGRYTAIFADDGEKFGVWPGTQRWVFDEGWLESFLDTVEGASSWLRPVTFSEHLDEEPPLGRVYLPTTSYMELGEWALPAEASRAYAEVVEELKARPDGERILRFVQGGAWRNFLAKYPESDWMHKRMLDVSGRIEEARSRGRREGEAALSDDSIEQARRSLYMAQCNDAYWHGVFGGLYLPHLRARLYGELIRAENIIAPGGAAEPEFMDLDCDGFDEAAMRTSEVSLFADPDDGGTLAEIDFRPAAVNLCNTLSRWYEGYHSRLERAAGGRGGGEHGGGARSIHDVVLVKEEGLERYLNFDDLRRTCLRLHVYGRGEGPESLRSCGQTELSDLHRSPYEAAFPGRTLVMKRESAVGETTLSVEKSVSLEGAVVTMGIRAVNTGAAPIDGLLLTVEFNVCLPGCAGPAVSLRLGDGAVRGLGVTGDDREVSSFELVDTYAGVAASFALDAAAGLWSFPVETVSLSEGGFERIYQGTALHIVYPLDLEAGALLERTLRLELRAV